MLWSICQCSGVHVSVPQNACTSTARWMCWAVVQKTDLGSLLYMNIFLKRWRLTESLLAEPWIMMYVSSTTSTSLTFVYCSLLSGPTALLAATIRAKRVPNSPSILRHRECKATLCIRRNWSRRKEPPIHLHCAMGTPASSDLQNECASRNGIRRLLAPAY